MSSSTNRSSGILAAATYLPIDAVPSRRGAVPVCGGDEDAVTLAIEAGLKLLPADGTTTGEEVIDELVIVASGPPLGGTHAEVVREALGLPETTRVGITTGGDRLGVISALLSAIDAVAVGRISRAVVIASEVGDGQQIGAGAAAVIVGTATEPTVRIVDVESEGAVMFDRWNEPTGQPGSNEPRYTQHTVERALGAILEKTGRPVGPIVLTGTSTSVARTAGLESGVRQILDFGLAGPVFAIITGARAGDRSYLVAAASGSRTALITCAATATAADHLPDPEINDIVAHGKPEAPISPMLSLPSSSPFFERSARELLRLEGARCSQCAHVVFPPTQRPVCSTCKGTTFEPQPLSRHGSVYTFTVNHFLPSGFGAQMILILAELDDGHRYWAPASGMAADDVKIGAPVRLGVRRFTNDGGVPVYAMKFLGGQSVSESLTAAS